MCSGSCAAVFSEPTYGLKVSFILRPVCCCTKSQRYMVSESGSNSRFRLVNNVI